MLRDDFLFDEMRHVSPRAFQALVVLLQHAGRNGKAFPGLDRCSEIMGASRDTARRAVEELVSRGLVTRVDRRGKTPIYTVAAHVFSRGSKSATPTKRTGSKSAEGDSKFAMGGIANLRPESDSLNQRRSNQTDDLRCSLGEKLVPVSQLKDWCIKTFTESPDGRASVFTREHLQKHHDTREMLLRVGVAHLTGELSEAFVVDGCEAMRHVDRWPDNPGGYLRSVWRESRHSPPSVGPGWFDEMLAAVELPASLLERLVPSQPTT